MDNILAINLISPNELQMKMARSFKKNRLAMSLTQQGLANRSGVSLGSLKRFESSGKIAFESLLKLALVLDLLDGFNKITQMENYTTDYSLDEIIKRGTKKAKSRGSLT